MWQILINRVKKDHSNYKKNSKKYVNFQTEQGGEMGQPDWNFRPRYKKCTLAF